MDSITERPSTKRPIKDSNKAISAKKTKEDVVLDEALSALKAVKEKNIDEDDVYGQTIAFSMRNIKNARQKAYAKIRIQQILFKAQFGVTDTVPSATSSQFSQPMSPQFQNVSSYVYN